MDARPFLRNLKKLRFGFNISDMMRFQYRVKLDAGQMPALCRMLQGIGFYMFERIPTLYFRLSSRANVCVSGIGSKNSAKWSA